jgi:AcrR family transcriptional regulator
MRTYRALSSALVELMQACEFDAITVQDLLNRAGVSRATFYSHFRNKDDFLLSDLERMLTEMEGHFDLTVGRSTRLAPIAELYEHFAEARQFAEAVRRSGRLEAVLDLTSGHLACIIERRLRAMGVALRGLPLRAASRVYGAMAIELAKWWLDNKNPFSAHDMDRQFHDLVWRGLGVRLA